MRTNSTHQGLTIACAIGLLLVIAGSARASSAPGDHTWPQQAGFASAAKAQPLAADANRTVVAHLDEESVPAAENPGAPALDGSAPDANPEPSADWERVPAEGAPPAPAKVEPSAPAASAAGADGGALPSAAASAGAGDGTRAPSAAVGASSEESFDHAESPAIAPPVPARVHPAVAIAPVASVQHTPVPEVNNVTGGSGAGGADTGGAGVQEVNLGPPPALDLGTLQSGPDLSSVSLADEFKKAGTPARAAALRVTEQARVELAAGKTDDALRDLGRAVSIDPGNPFEYFYLGRAYIARGNYAQALTFLQRAEIGFRPRADWLGETVGFEGACEEELGQTSEGALTYRRALGSAPNNLRARVGLSRLSGYLPSTAAADDASTASEPIEEALPPPEHAAAGPAPEEAAPPPPPEPDAPEGAATKAPAADYQPD